MIVEIYGSILLPKLHISTIFQKNQAIQIELTYHTFEKLLAYRNLHTAAKDFAEYINENYSDKKMAFFGHCFLPSNPNRIDLSYIRETIGTKTIVSTETIRHLIEFTFPKQLFFIYFLHLEII